jgi:hypothetical protein
MLEDEPQESRTTVDHAIKRGVGKKGPDWWTIPVSKDRHVHGNHSIDKLGRNGFREHWDLPPYEWMALTFLGRYINTGQYKKPVLTGERSVEPRPIDARSAAAYFQLLQRLIKNGKHAKSWNWTPPQRAGAP